MLMHWFWRVTIAALVGCSYAGLAVFPLRFPHEFVSYKIAQALGGSRMPSWQLGVGVSFSYFLPVLLLAFGVYGLATRFFAPRPPDLETRCRKCGYILRGISEPRCSECGERI